MTLDEFARAHGDDLLRLALLLTGQRADAEDLVQDCLVRIAPRLDKIVNDNPAGYARTVLVNIFLDGRRRHSRLRRLLPMLAGPEVTPSVDADVVRRSHLQSLVTSLPPRQRAVVVLRYWSGLTEAETAEVLECSIGTVKSQSSSALATLRNRIAHETVMEGSHHA